MAEAKLMGFLEDMERAAKDVQGRLLARDTEGLWSALARQEQAVENLTVCYEQHPDEFRGLSERNDGARSLLERSRSLLHANRAVSRTFLQVIDRTLSHLSGSGPAAYSGYGAGMRASGPLLVSQQG